MNFNDDEEAMREFERLFMKDYGGFKAIGLDSNDDIELFEKMVKELILPHLMGPSGQYGTLDSIKVLRLEKEEKSNEGFKWLDKYL